MGLRNSLKQRGADMVSEFITNKQVDRGILDYDKWQEYNAKSKSATPDQQQTIANTMTQQWIIDPIVYKNYLDTQKATQDKQLADPNSDLSISNLKKKETDDFKSSLNTAVKPWFLQWDRYQKEVITKATEALTSQYETMSDNVIDTLRDYDNPELKNTWNSVKQEYQDLIKNAAGSFADKVSKGTSYKEAYNQIIKEGEDKAKRIVQIQNQLSNKQFKAWILWWLEQAVEWWIWNRLEWARKAMSNTIAWAFALWWQAVEAIKQKTIWWYDVLEELHNLWVYKNDENFKQIKELSHWWAEMIDGAPSWLPEMAWFTLGNKLREAGEVPELLTSGAKKLWMANKNLEVSKRARFVSENMQDFIMNDAIAQASMWRPMTEDDIKTNWLMNVPINLTMSRLIPTQWMTKTLPIKAMDTNTISDWVLAYLKTDGAAIDDISKAVYLDKAYQMWLDKKWAWDIISKWVKWDEDLFKQANQQKSISQLQADWVLNDAEVAKYNEAISKLESWQQDIKKWKMTLDDMALLDLWDRIVATKTATLWQIKPQEAVWTALDRINYITDWIKTKNVYSDSFARSMNNLTAQNIITPEDYKTITDKFTQPWTIARAILDLKIPERIDEASNTIKSLNSSGQWWASTEWHQQINNAYDAINMYILKNLDSYNIKPGNAIWNFTYIGKDENWVNRFRNQFWDNIPNNQWLTDVDIYAVLKWREREIWWKVATYNNILDEIKTNRFTELPPVIDATTGKPTYNITKTFSWVLSNKDLLAKEYVWWEMTKALSPFWIKYDKDIWRITITESWLKKLSDAANKFEQQWWNVSNISKDQMQAYKVIFMHDYLTAVSNFKTKWKDFVTYFESLYKELPDGSYALNLKFLSSTEAWKIVWWVMDESKDFVKTESAAAQLKTEDIFKDIIAWVRAPSYTKKPTAKEMADSLYERADDWLSKEDITWVKWLLNQYTNKWLEDKLLSLVSFVKDSKDKAILTQWLSNIIWDVLWDWKSNAYIQELFEDMDSIPVYRNIITSMLVSDDEFCLKYLDNVNHVLEQKDMAKLPFYEEIEKVRDILNPVKGKAPIDSNTKANMIRILNTQQELFEKDSIIIPETFYKQYDTVKNEIHWQSISQLSNSQIENYSKSASIATLEKYWVTWQSMYNKLYPKIQSILQSFQEKFPDIKINTRWWYKWIWVDVVNNVLHIDDAISLHALVNLLKKDQYDKYVFNHEAQHLLTYNWIKENVAALAKRIQENIKALEQVPENKNLDELLFYNKDSLNKAMWLIDIISDDKNQMIQSLLSIPQDKSIPELYKVIGDVEEAINEQMALYQTYNYISDKGLVDKVKDKLLFLEWKLDDNNILQVRKSFAWEKDLNKLTEYLTSMPKSVEASTVPAKKEVQKISTSQVNQQFNTPIKDFLNWKESSLDKIREEDFNTLAKLSVQNPVAPIGDIFNIMDSSMSYIAWPYWRQIKLMFWNTANVDIKSMFIWKDTIWLRQKQGMKIPFDVFATNKMVANILSSMGKYTPEIINSINGDAYVEIVNQMIKSMNKEKEYTVSLLLKKLESYWIDTSKQLSKMELEWMHWYIIKAIDTMINKQGSDNVAIRWLYKLINEVYGLNKWKQWAEFFTEGFHEWIDSQFILNTIDTIADEATDAFKLQYDINLIGKDAPLRNLPFNSLLATLWLKWTDGIKDLANTKMSRQLVEVAKWNYYADLSTKIVYNWIKQSFDDWLIKELTFRIWDKTISITKQDYDKLNPYELLNKFINGLVNEDKKLYNISIDWVDKWIHWSNRFFNSIPWKLILEKLENTTSIKYLYSPFATPSIWLLDKSILQKIYDSLNLKKWFDNTQSHLRERQEILSANKSLSNDEIELKLKAFLETAKKNDDIINLTEDDLRYIKSKASKGINWTNKFSKQEWELINSLRWYLYPNKKSSIDATSKSFMEQLTKNPIQIRTKDWFKKSDWVIIAVRPKIDIIQQYEYKEPWIMWEEKYGESIINQTYWDKWLPVSDISSIISAKPYDEYLTETNVHNINYNDWELLVKIQSKDWKQINWIAIMDKWKINIVPIDNIKLEYIPVSVKDYSVMRKSAYKEIDESSWLIQKHLTC